ncbi:DUF6612 family protein [Paenibacillus sp. GYB003]|uniref:DUF6612 family protein n=1 Tax=Paenibacillus sp. GYB003 TaxID=2994392 RepID=UPI002F9680DC
MRTNKWTRAAATALLAVSMMAVAACGQKPEQDGSKQAAAPNAETPAKAPESNQTTETPKPKTAGDVFMKSMEATAKLESFSVNMNMKQAIEQAGQKMDIQSKIDMDVVMKPQMAFKQTMSMNMMGQDVKLESYMTKDGFFMKQGEPGQWMKLPKEQSDLITSAMSEAQLDPSKQLDKLKQFANDFTMTENGNDYTVKLSANGDKFNEFIQNEMKELLGKNPGAEQLLQQSGATPNIKKVEYTFAIDKKTNFPKSMNVIMDMEIEVEGQKTHMVQNMEGTYANYNGIKEIVVPKEALEAKPVGATQ